MTKINALKLKQAAESCGIELKAHKTGTQRMNVTIAGKTYGGYNRAMDAITTQYLKAKSK
jgi:hypothetical protein